MPSYAMRAELETIANSPVPDLGRLECSLLYSEELGIDLSAGREDDYFRWFLASLLFGGHIGETQAEGYPTVWAKVTNCSGGSRNRFASLSYGTAPRNTVASPSDAQNRYTFWPMNPVSTEA